MTLASLLLDKLQIAIAASADPRSVAATEGEEQEGVAYEETWNHLAAIGSYGLIDSKWKIDPAITEGKIRLRYALRDTMVGTIVCAAVETVYGPDGKTVLAERDSSRPLPPVLHLGRTLIVPWARASAAPVPQYPLNVEPLLKMHPIFDRYTPQPIPVRKGWKCTCHCILYQDELAWRSYGDSWLLLFSIIKPEKPRQQEHYLLRTLRDGVNDITGRVPTLRALRSKRIALFGIGAVGAPIAVELARNGCEQLRLVDHDIIQPGNTVRWPIGASAFGLPKFDALGEFLAREYPATQLAGYRHALGTSPPPGCPVDYDRSQTVLDAALNGADLVIDATSERGINWLLNDICLERGLPLIDAHATPNVAGGIVARFVRSAAEGCRICLDHHWLDHHIPEPPGLGAEEESLTHQPPGCAERTFVGTSFDLQEFSLQAVRLAVDTLSGQPQYPPGSLVQVASFVEGTQRVPPVWRSFPIARHAECRDHRE